MSIREQRRARQQAKQAETSRRKAATFRARWKQIGKPCPSKVRWLAKQNALNAYRRANGMCPDCGIFVEKFVYCQDDRVRRAKNNAEWWRRNKAA